MSTTVQTEMTLTFDAYIYAERRDDQWVFFAERVVSDGGLFHIPSDEEDVELEEFDAAQLDALAGVEPGAEWEDLTPTQRVRLVEIFNEEV